MTLDLVHALPPCPYQLVYLSSLKPSSLIWCLILAQTVVKKELLEKEVEGALVALALSLLCSLCLQSTKMLLGFTSEQGKAPLY